MPETLKETKKCARKDRLRIRKNVVRNYGSGPFSKATKRLIRREVDEKVKLHMENKLYKIKFERGRVRVRLPGHPIKGVTIWVSKLIHHFNPEEIRRAALTYLIAKARGEL
jgi:hypothetical protein